jgi:glutamine cyclotransferase
MSSEARISNPSDAYEIVGSWDHDSGAFTEGLVYHYGLLYESTGGNKNTREIGLSSARRVELKTGTILKKVPVDSDYFAEGLTIFGDQLIQLTWRSQKALVYDLKSFEYLREVPYREQMEGWGLTRDRFRLIMSDGTHRLRFIDPVTFETLDSLFVYEGGKPLSSLNELEYVRGEIYANILGQDRLVRIDPQSGRMLGWVDLAKLRPKDSDVLNGIAHNPANRHLFITGKYWPQLFEICLSPPCRCTSTITRSS